MNPMGHEPRGMAVLAASGLTAAAFIGWLVSAAPAFISLVGWADEAPSAAATRRTV